MKLFKKPIFVSISPNAQADDVWLALRLIFCPWRWKEGKCVEKFEEMLRKYLEEPVRGQDPDKVRAQTPDSTLPQPSPYKGEGAICLFESGRTALYAILQALGIKQGDEVLIQAFTCTAAVNPILWVGAKPIYVDIEDGTYNMSPEDLKKKITPRCKAVIIQHTFGFPGRINEILEIAQKHNLIVLEDCAHALGAEYCNQKIGTFGEASFFSFGRSKVISSVFGGAAYTRNSELAEKIREIQRKWQYPSYRWILQQLFHPIYLAIAKPLYNFLGIGKMMIVIGKKLRLISIMVYSVEKSGGKPPFGPAKMPNALACLGINQMKKLERFNEHRRRIAEFYHTQLSFLRKQESIKIPPDPPLQKGGDGVFLNFPIQVKNFGTRWKLIGAARKKGAYLESWPAKDKKVVGPDNVNLEKLHYTEGTCPNAEKAAQTSVNLPTSPNTTIDDARKVAKFLRKFFGEIKT
jgi:dTDP-4-amino-4,6-dideoxygalactose transaminase